MLVVLAGAVLPLSGCLAVAATGAVVGTAVVAIVVGWTNWLGASATPAPVLGEAPAPRRPEGPGQGM